MKVAADKRDETAAPFIPYSFINITPAKIDTIKPPALAYNCKADLPRIILPGKKIYKPFSAMENARRGTYPAAAE